MLQCLLGECYCCQSSIIKMSIPTIHVYHVLGTVLVLYLSVSLNPHDLECGDCFYPYFADGETKA